MPVGALVFRAACGGFVTVVVNLMYECVLVYRLSHVNTLTLCSMRLSFALRFLFAPPPPPPYHSQRERERERERVQKVRVGSRCTREQHTLFDELDHLVCCVLVQLVSPNPTMSAVPQVRCPLSPRSVIPPCPLSPWARMHGKGFCYPAGKPYPGGSYRGGKNLVWFACMSHGRAGR